ncbi:ATP-binding cassette domain-containing protein [Pasteurella multocida]|uniref:ATP-binding cassette domain-containing protein n=1 Tax=Pasteurella multocida TaxID=747 RepID=UPI0032F139D7|nr:ATP-binding cassette domain-containing protein [Pasteurella multocida]HDR1170069.1 ATP-binding cassette domain-containing protein [Pasteurella multocida]HDR1176302.1 ATP-binding cassette domain-containing protein [Pasteurella multocida]
MTQITFKNISKIYGKACHQALALLNENASNSDIFQATGCQIGLRNINLQINGNGIFCIIGLSGSGKSTLVRHINRLIEPSSGEVWVCDTNVTALNSNDLRKFRQTRVSMVFQHFGLLPHLTVQQNVAYALKVRGMSNKEQKEQAEYWLNEVGLAGYERAYPAQLSGGMRQRVGLARALTADTDIILMDEAFSALDPLIRIKLQDLVLNLQQRLNKCIVFITHDIDEAIKMGNQIAILNAGELIQVGTPQELLQKPTNNYVAQFMQTAKCHNHC